MRHISKGIHKLWQKDVVKCGNVKYYPRKPDHKDPPIKPTKLFMVERVKPYKGNPYWEKNILEELKLDPESDEKIAIVKNTPEICSTLWRIKHLVKITPINLPENLPEDLLTNKETYLHENGQLMVFPRIDMDRLEATNKFKSSVKKFDAESMKKYLRLKWLNPMESQGSRH